MIETASIFHVECPSCHTSFPVDPAKVPEGGVLARCSECPAIFPVKTPDDLLSSPPASAPPVPETFSPEPEMFSLEPEILSPEPVEEASEASVGVEEPPDADLDVHFQEVDLEPTPVEPAPAAPTAFGKRDPEEKARRLARVLVSDMITYNAKRHKQALENDTLEADFEDEIKKSWSEYVDQVGQEMAESTDYFTQALNEILAQGKQLF